MSILSYVIYKLNAIPIKIPMAFFWKKYFLKICVESQMKLNTQNNFERKKQNWRPRLSDFKT